MQTGLGCRIGQTREVFLHALLFSGDRCCLLGGRVDDAFELGLTRGQAALGKLRFLGLTLQAALLLAAIVQAALGIDDGFVQLGMPLLAVRQLHVELFKTRFGCDTTFLKVSQLGFDF